MEFSLSLEHMKIALISDIHGNLPALEACLKKIDALAPDVILCLGDLVGYGPQPNEVIEVIRGRNIPCVEGNHDAGVNGRMPVGFFREPNQSLIRWTAEHLTAENMEYLSGLKLSYSSGELREAYPVLAALPDDYFLMVHASPSRPERWDYLNSAIACRKVLEEFPHQFVFVGHTHIPALVANELGVFGLEPGFRFVANPGAVGQNRDGDPRACFAVLDTEAFTYTPFRVEYSVQTTLAAYQKVGLDLRTGKRLLHV